MVARTEANTSLSKRGRISHFGLGRDGNQQNYEQLEGYGTR